MTSAIANIPTAKNVLKSTKFSMAAMNIEVPSKMIPIFSTYWRAAAASPEFSVPVVLVRLDRY